MIPPEAITAYLHGVDDLRHQRDGARLGPSSKPVAKRRAMATGLGALHDDRVDPGPLERNGLVHRRSPVPIANIPRAFTASSAPGGSRPSVKLKTDAPVSNAASSLGGEAVGRRRGRRRARQPELREERRHAVQRGVRLPPAAAPAPARTG
jgi:hypothetical protein